MQLKQYFSFNSPSSKLRLFWERITFSRITKFYFVFSVLHCVVQLVFQVEAYLINAQAADFLFSIIEQGNAFDPGFAVMGKDDLRFCDSIPNGFSTEACQVIWSESAVRGGSLVGQSESLSYESSTATSSLASSTSSAVSTTSSSTTTSSRSASSTSFVATVTGIVDIERTTTKTVVAVTAAPSVVRISSGDHDHDDDDEKEEDDDVEDDRDFDRLVRRESAFYDRSLGKISAVSINGSTVVNVNGLGWNNEQKNLTQRCLFTLNWPVEVLDNTKREDVTFIVFQIWVLGMSIVALLNESMPHIFASLLTHVLATGWGGFQVVNTRQFHASFAKLTTNGACGVNLLPTYWNARAAAEIPSVALNALALLISMFLSWRLIKLFGWQTFKRVGASRTINRVYMMVLSLSIAIQLSLFFIVASIALWIDQLYNGSIGRLATMASVYKGVLITVLVLLFPWLALGWVSVRRELRIPMVIFLAMSVGYLVGWGGMFASTSFRWTFVNWRFFSVIISASLLLTIITFFLGLACRLNFGKGLPKYLTAHEPLPDDFVVQYPGGESPSGDLEKVEFPTARGGIPTFSAAFGRGDEVPPPSQMQFGPPRLGPRFSNPDAEPFEPQPGDEDAASLPSMQTTTYSRPAMGEERRDVTADGMFSTTSLARQLSNGSQKSFDSYKSSGSIRSTGSTGSFKSVSSMKRWVIE